MATQTKTFGKSIPERKEQLKKEMLDQGMAQSQLPRLPDDGSELAKLEDKWYRDGEKIRDAAEEESRQVGANGHQKETTKYTCEWAGCQNDLPTPQSKYCEQHRPIVYQIGVIAQQYSAACRSKGIDPGEEPKAKSGHWLSRAMRNFPGQEVETLRGLTAKPLREKLEAAEKERTYTGTLKPQKEPVKKEEKKEAEKPCTGFCSRRFLSYVVENMDPTLISSEAIQEMFRLSKEYEHQQKEGEITSV